ncbi:MAG: haloacid dehalogenase [Ignisphaera sp.]|uniref:Haloacid dehalogenase n=1 Tax=Ignisphaera aggregans TaxID=334771 RepID=A0A7C4D2E8_9CREN
MDTSYVKNYLDSLESARESLIKKGRDILNLCRSIISGVVLGKNVEEDLYKVSKLFNEVYEQIKSYPELVYSNIFYSIAAEYVEAIQLYSIVTQTRFLSIEELNVHPIPYLLGLADTIGELKRCSLESVRKNKFDEAFKLLELAEELYNRLSIFSYPDALLPGFRRKLDVYRRVIDDWKKFLIDMVSRKNLIDVLKVCYRD